MKGYTEKGCRTLLLSFDVDSCQHKGFHTTNEKSGTGGFFFLVYLRLWSCEFVALPLAAQEQSQWCFSALCCYSDLKSSIWYLIMSFFLTSTYQCTDGESKVS